MSTLLRGTGRAYLLSAPALVLFSVLLLLPLALTLVLSFNVFDYETGVKEGSYTLAHYLALLSDPYYYEISLSKGLQETIC
ncbi:hypothetical protein SB18R_04200 [Pseudomonas oryzihabitans]|nr:hypothetical protein SB9_16000 [Pseudomonas psychrotolerans]KTT77865.1 hypothetical protein SB18R_04200 [Pseudomonas psychrotolerans]